MMSRGNMHGFLTHDHTLAHIPSCFLRHYVCWLVSCTSFVVSAFSGCSERKFSTLPVQR